MKISKSRLLEIIREEYSRMKKLDEEKNKKEYLNNLNEEKYQAEYSIETLPNGYIEIFDRGTKLSGLFKPDGSQVSGDLHLDNEQALKAIDDSMARLQAWRELMKSKKEVSEKSMPIQENNLTEQDKGRYVDMAKTSLKRGLAREEVLERLQKNGAASNIAVSVLDEVMAELGQKGE